MNTLNQEITMIDDGFEHMALPPTYEEPPTLDRSVKGIAPVLICTALTLGTVIAAIIAIAR